MHRYVRATDSTAGRVVAPATGRRAPAKGRMSPLLRTLVLSPACLVACSSDPAATTTDAPEGAPVWYPEVQTIVVQSCGGCHTERGDAPFPLDIYAFAGPLAETMLASVEDGSMPPWHADPRHGDER